VIDFGTATTFDVVSAKGEYLGGLIAPGIVISLDALFFRASKLPRVELTAPRQVIGKNTIESIQSGILYGYVGLVDGIVERIFGELGKKVHTLATGGLALLIAPHSRTINQVEPDLTLHGLRLLYKLNRPTPG
jgi:type III pantothenate kinase